MARGRGDKGAWSVLRGVPERSEGAWHDEEGIMNHKRGASRGMPKRRGVEY